MTTFKDYMLAYFDNLMFNHSNFLLKSTLLEAYTDSPITKNQVLNSLKFVNLNLINRNEDDENIIDDLNDEFISIGIMFEKYQNSSYGKLDLNPLYKNAGIMAAEYSPDDSLIHIYINDKFINQFKSNSFDNIARGIVGISGHENTHRQQFLSSKGKIKGTDSETLNFKTITDFKKYLSSQIEIDAHAREVAIYLYNSNVKGNTLIQMLNTNHKGLFNSTAYEKYWKYFGKNILENKNFDKNDLKVWKRFLKRIAAYLQTTDKYKYTVDPKAAIQNLTNIEKEVYKEP